MNLIIVESPTKARTLSRFLGKDYLVEATMGHIRDLPQSKFGIKINENFEPEYTVVPKKDEIISKLKKDFKKAQKIYLATDPDREGEAIAWHVSQILSAKDTKKLSAKKKKDRSISQPNILVSRIVFHEITEKAIKHALEKPRSIDMDLVNAQQARRILDRIVGYKLSPLLWFKIRKGLSAGRVQSVAVRLIVEREREIEKFVPIEYWEIYCDLKKQIGGNLPEAPVFRAKLVKVNGKKADLSQADETESAACELTKAGFEVGEIEKKESKRFAPPPFTTSTLQQTAANRLGWSSKRTMQVAQKLYEQGLITYHRTDSTNMADEAINACRDFIKAKYGIDFLPDKPKFYKTKSKVAQEAHEAIRPTDVNVKSKIENVKFEEEKRLYELIWKRFVACQIKEAIFDDTKVNIVATSDNLYLLEATGRIIKFSGWLTLYDNKIVSENGGNGENEGRLPEMVKGDELKLVKVDPLQKFTQPPARYNEASLIKTLEEYGIGRPSTYAPTISTISDRQYVEKEDNRFKPTNLGFAVNDFLNEYFPEIVDYDFTAKMEDNLDEIAEGHREWVPTLKEFYEPFDVKLKNVSKVAERVTVETELTDEICPQCGAPLVVRIGKYGKFLSCSKFPECKFTKPLVREAGFLCPECGGKMIIKKTKKGRLFYGCEKWPQCKYATWRKPESKND